MENSFRNMSLTPEMLTLMYGHSLVIPVEKPGSAAAEEATIKFLGGNARNIIVLVNDAKHTFIADQEMQVLTKILEACRLNIGDVAIVNSAGTAVSFELLFEQLAPRKILSFGADTGAPVFSLTDKNGIPVLTAPLLLHMVEGAATAKQVKVKLWGLLKVLFEL